MGKQTRSHRRQRRHSSVRLKVQGSTDRPRLNVFRSLSQIYAQIVDDSIGHTLAAASTLDPELKSQLKGMSKVEQARVVGKAIAERALGGGIEQVVFDRGGYQYHGRVRALAEAAREAGLKF